MVDARDLTPRLVAHCRAGFEPEAAADLRRVAAAAEAAVAVDAPLGRGFVVATPERFDAQRWPRALTAAPPIFVRALFFGTGPHALLDGAPTKGRANRVTPLAAMVEAFRTGFPLPGAPHKTRGRLVFDSVRLETPDTNDGKELSGICRAVETPLADALREGGILESGSTMRALHVLFADGAHAYVGASMAPWGSPWPMGIPRLRMPAGAPSRSTLKLAEAFVTFLGERELELVHAGMRAVDLGAAPGGWTWQLAHRGLRVTAVDNGPLKGEVAQDPLVTHLRSDGITYLPRRPVDWLVCDIAEQPSRIAALVARWIGEGHARRAIFNLKLPMKRRFEETMRCRQIVEDLVRRARVNCGISLRQLYHDRREVTGFVERLD
ncbi:MAG TPA: 23S rRNA (cytidine(2498)-2'-O)-methyltransferase RlmM [Casimicrobiaceae bacterium]|nr:23S rRNA (cytidine(2498)-2'-O)-methyltransferase RlmM [Casimicrobiaceae bacterium]